MKDRIREIIDLKTNGNQSEFAGVMGWQPQYITRLLKGESIGLNTIITILNNYPDISPSWLLLGVGDMLNGGVRKAVKIGVIDYVAELLELEKHIDTMTPQELNRLDTAIKASRGEIAKVRR